MKSVINVVLSVIVVWIFIFYLNLSNFGSFILFFLLIFILIINNVSEGKYPFLYKNKKVIYIISVVLVLVAVATSFIITLKKSESPYDFQLREYESQVTSDVPSMGPIIITVIDPITQKPIPNLNIEYYYEIELPPVKNATTAPPHKTSSTEYSTDQAGKVTIPQTAVVPHFYGANIVINPGYASHNNDFGQFDFHLPAKIFSETDFPDSAVLHITTNSQNLNIELVPNLANSTECQSIATKNIRQCCILRAKKSPNRNCESLFEWFGNSDSFRDIE